MSDRFHSRPEGRPRKGSSPASRTSTATWRRSAGHLASQPDEGTSDAALPASASAPMAEVLGRAGRLAGLRGTAQALDGARSPADALPLDGLDAIRDF